LFFFSFLAPSLLVLLLVSLPLSPFLFETKKERFFLFSLKKKEVLVWFGRGEYLQRRKRRRVRKRDFSLSLSSSPSLLSPFFSPSPSFFPLQRRKPGRKKKKALLLTIRVLEHAAVHALQHRGAARRRGHRRDCALGERRGPLPRERQREEGRRRGKKSGGGGDEDERKR
jgi:hypothetical protein